MKEDGRQRSTSSKRRGPNTYAAVMTGRGTGAISTISLVGRGASQILAKIFKPAGGGNSSFEIGRVFVGEIEKDNEGIDEVTIGVEGENLFAINCHGNPLIAADITALLKAKGAKIISSEQFLRKVLSRGCKSTIEVEARIKQCTAKTLMGTKIILSQIDYGLGRCAKRWIEKLNKTNLTKIRAEAGEVLKDSETARLIIEGVKIAITGPPHAGKSSLFNRLAGANKSIVPEEYRPGGTTRDYVTADCLIGPLYVELIDTAGVDNDIADGDRLSKAAQRKTIEMIKPADVVLLVLDSSNRETRIDGGLLKKISGKRVQTILNKCDLPTRLEISSLPAGAADVVRISAKTGQGIENLIRKIIERCGAADFSIRSPVCITARQGRAVKRIASAKSVRQAREAITGLLNGGV